MPSKRNRLSDPLRPMEKPAEGTAVMVRRLWREAEYCPRVEVPRKRKWQATLKRFLFRLWSPMRAAARYKALYLYLWVTAPPAPISVEEYEMRRAFKKLGV